MLDIPPEIILHILSYLDLPDLAALAQVSPMLAGLTSDPVLHRNRVKVIAPSRIQHSLFGASSHGLALRPTIGDLIHRDVIRGLGIERRWRMGTYFYSRNSVLQYENGLRLARHHASSVVSDQLRRRSSPNMFLNSLHVSHILPDIESSSLTVSRMLLPVIHQLKWSIQRDRLAKIVRIGLCRISDHDGSVNFHAWYEKKGQSIVEDGERVRLALCPDIRKVIGFYEDLIERSL